MLWWAQPTLHGPPFEVSIVGWIEARETQQNAETTC